MKIYKSKLDKTIGHRSRTRSRFGLTISFVILFAVCGCRHDFRMESFSERESFCPHFKPTQMRAIGQTDPLPSVCSDPRFSAIDFHTHLGSVFTYPGALPDFPAILSAMDLCHINSAVDFKAPDNSLVNGIYGEKVTERLKIYPDPKRFILFANIPYDDIRDKFVGDYIPDYPAWVAAVFENSIKLGARGLKLRTQVGGLTDWSWGNPYAHFTTDKNDILVPHDTPALDPLWTKIESLRVPASVHLGTRRLSYQENNPYPATTNQELHWEILMLERERLLRKHPRLIYIGQHMASLDEDIEYLEEVVTRYPNFFFESVWSYPVNILLPYLVKFQDRILFGTDFMEGLSFQEPYAQELSGHLSMIEKSTMSLEVRDKMYFRNASKILGIDTSGAPPVAHAGFSSTVLIGNSVELNGSNSFDFSNSSLNYAWKQTLGQTEAILSDSKIAKPTFSPMDIGQYGFQLNVQTAQGNNSTHQILINVIDEKGVYLEKNGIITIEAEHFYKNIIKTDQTWQQKAEQPGFSGTGYMETGPTATMTQKENPELQYKIYITSPGTYVVSIRGSSSLAQGNMIHAGLDGEETRLADKIGYFPLNGWAWKNKTHEKNIFYLEGKEDENLAVMNIELGYHILNIWTGSPNFKFDKIFLARHPYAQKKFPVLDLGSLLGPRESPIK